MPDPTTTAKGLTQPTVGADNNVWGGLLNTNAGLIDSAFGGTVSIPISGTTTAIASPTIQNSGYYFNGALTAVNTITWTKFFGLLTIRNSTSGGYNLLCGIAGGVFATVLNGETTVLWADGVNFFRLSAPVYPGFMQPYAVATPPTGWLYADGSVISRTTFAALFNTIGTTFGAGNGTTTFNIPDMRGRIPGGYDASNTTNRLTSTVTGGISAATLGNTGGVQDHTLATTQLPAHGHGVTDGTHSHGINDGGHAHGYSDPGHTHTTNASSQVDANQNWTAQGINGLGVSTISSSGVGITILSSGSNISAQSAGSNISVQNTGGGGAHNNIQPTLIVGWIIKF
jgi:microcystin-dependent protein